jgi:hypothetical protein
MRNIKENIAFVYNALGVLVAAGVLYPFFGILLSPMIAAAAMSFSSVSVIGSAPRLRRARFELNAPPEKHKQSFSLGGDLSRVDLAPRGCSKSCRVKS